MEVFFLFSRLDGNISEVIVYSVDLDFGGDVFVECGLLFLFFMIWRSFVFWEEAGVFVIIFIDFGGRGSFGSTCSF